MKKSPANRIMDGSVRDDATRGFAHLHSSAHGHADRAGTTHAGYFHTSRSLHVVLAATSHQDSMDGTSKQGRHVYFNRIIKQKHNPSNIHHASGDISSHVRFKDKIGFLD
jgi:hypothetical protein